MAAKRATPRKVGRIEATVTGSDARPTRWILTVPYKEMFDRGACVEGRVAASKLSEKPRQAPSSEPQRLRKRVQKALFRCAGTPEWRLQRLL